MVKDRVLFKVVRMSDDRCEITFGQLSQLEAFDLYLRLSMALKHLLSLIEEQERQGSITYVGDDIDEN